MRGARKGAGIHDAYESMHAVQVDVHDRPFHSKILSILTKQSIIAEHVYP
jgi:hypothetical protein